MPENSEVRIITRNVWSHKEFIFLYNLKTQLLLRKAKDLNHDWGLYTSFEQAAEFLKFAGYEIIDYDGYAPKTAILSRICEEQGIPVTDIKISNTALDEYFENPLDIGKKD